MLIEGFEEEQDGKKKSNLMIYSGQAVKRGAFFYHGFTLQNVSPLEVGALLHALQQWEAAGGTLGGSARIGHGKIDTSFFFQNGEDFFGNELNRDQVIAEYKAHTEKNKERIAAWLESAFPRNAEKKGKKKNAEENEEEGLGL
jgi:CRISPR type IV-associated protein Csf2